MKPVIAAPFLIAGSLFLLTPSHSVFADNRVGADREVTKEQVLESLERIGSYSADQKDKAVEDLNSLSDRVSAEIERMEADIEQGGDDAEGLSEQALQDMKHLGSAISDKASAAADTSAEGWASFQDSMSGFYNDFSASVSKWWKGE